MLIAALKRMLSRNGLGVPKADFSGLISPYFVAGFNLIQNRGVLSLVA
jgi:hypothetical protein